MVLGDERSGNVAALGAAFFQVLVLLVVGAVQGAIPERPVKPKVLKLWAPYGCILLASVAEAALRTVWPVYPFPIARGLVVGVAGIKGNGRELSVMLPCRRGDSLSRACKEGSYPVSWRRTQWSCV